MSEEVGWLLRVLPPSASQTEALGLTVEALMLFVSGAIGAWMRVVVSATQNVRSQRTVVDMLLGACVGVLLPVYAPLLNALLSITFDDWTPLQQSVLAVMLGGSGSYFWTAIGWRKGLIVTPHQATQPEKPPAPEVGVLKETLRYKK